MEPRDAMNDFLNTAAEHLKKNNGAFLEKLEKGDIAAIKMIFEFVNKNNSKLDSKQTKNKNDSANIKDMEYDEAFNFFKDNLAETNSEEDTD